MNYGSICSGVEAATLAWHHLGWRPSFFSEIDDFPRAVLQCRYPEVPLHGDFTTIQRGTYGPIDLLVGGTPCQSFSISGLRGGLEDARGNLTLEFVKLAVRLRPRWLLWENVPGVLSSNNGRDFGSLLGGLAECGYGFAYRVLDAQFFGVPQQRRRVFVVGYYGDWRPPAAVLFDRESLQGFSPPRRKSRREDAGGASGDDGAAGFLMTDERSGQEVWPPIISETDTTRSHAMTNQDLSGKFSQFVPVRGASQGDIITTPDGTSSTLRSTRGGAGVASDILALPAEEAGIMRNLGGYQGDAIASEHGIAPTVPAGGGNSGGGGGSVLMAGEGTILRRFTPREAERLQGMPDDWTNVPWRGRNGSPDTRRYKAIGNSMAVPVMKDIGERIQAVEEFMNASNRV